MTRCALFVAARCDHLFVSDGLWEDWDVKKARIVFDQRCCPVRHQGAKQQSTMSDHFGLVATLTKRR